MMDTSTDKPRGFGASMIRIGVVEDHEVFVDGLHRNLADEPDLEVVASAATVEALITRMPVLDLVILDLLLPDESSPRENVMRLAAVGVHRVLVLTSGDRPDLVRDAARAGVLAVIRKSETSEAIRAAIRAVAAGDTVGSIDWAAAIDADPNRAGLAPREEETLALYASGESARGVAALMGITPNTVKLYLSRIREKYAAVQRPANTKSELRQAAIDDGYTPRAWWRRR
ncbi:response regulator [Nocardia ninae]|uniref:DNA-binding response regulator n=1 Tax=Nocardia ninae NBRC 108245 TaxID=1210091 RepID=A0A511MKF5_9NOCA|nr:response regulator [Nocardia ninae]GEM40406.1 DNA-binding response regulator [Nocardia ninae NBRC 108245]